MKWYPLKFAPIYKDYPWGNTRLPQLFDREAPAGIYAESWEISDRPEGESWVLNGSCAGQTLGQLLARNAAEILGSAVSGTRFPLLIKLLDAAQPLSVQVHPNTQNATTPGDAKTEVWYFLNNEPAHIYCGLKPGVTEADLVAALQNQTVKSLLRTAPAEKGHAAFIPGGRVHAVDTGCLILEVQQNSDTTYRLYDWGRTKQCGQPRELHIEQALRIIDFNDDSDPICQPTEKSDGIRSICTTPFFELDEVSLNGSINLRTDGQTFHVLFCAEGPFEINYGAGASEPVAKGTSVLIPAALGPYTLRSDGDLTVLQISVPGEVLPK
jgi:mannose-6-phosphate isomerase